MAMLVDLGIRRTGGEFLENGATRLETCRAIKWWTRRIFILGVYICDIYIYIYYIYNTQIHIYIYINAQYANTYIHIYIYIQLRLHCQVRSSYDVIFTPVSTLESTKTSLVALIMEHLPLILNNLDNFPWVPLWLLKCLKYVCKSPFPG